MPNVTIEVKKVWTESRQQQIIDAVHGAMISALKIPVRDKLIRYIEHAPNQFQTPPGTTDNFVLVEITMFTGRSLAAKRHLYREIVERFGELEIEPVDIRIVLHEVPLENWGIRGGIPASEVELGFEVNT